MKVLDATFLIDYLNGDSDTADFLYENKDEHFVVPAPTYAEALVGEGNAPDGVLEEAISGLDWVEVVEIDAPTAVLAGQISDEVGPQGPFLTGMDALVAAVAHRLAAPLVTSDGDLTHEAVNAVIAVETYRS